MISPRVLFCFLGPDGRRHFQEAFVLLFVDQPLRKSVPDGCQIVLVVHHLLVQLVLQVLEIVPILSLDPPNK